MAREAMSKHHILHILRARASLHSARDTGEDRLPGGEAGEHPCTCTCQVPPEASSGNGRMTFIARGMDLSLAGECWSLLARGSMEGSPGPSPPFPGTRQLSPPCIPAQGGSQGAQGRAVRFLAPSPSWASVSPGQKPCVLSCSGPSRAPVLTTLLFREGPRDGATGRAHRAEGAPLMDSEMHPFGFCVCSGLSVRSHGLKSYSPG